MKLLGKIFLLSILGACGSLSQEDNQSTFDGAEVNDSGPDDSTGTTAELKVSVGTLMLSDSTTLTSTGTVSLSAARLSMSSLKVKPKKDLSLEEKVLIKKELNEEKDLVKNLEASFALTQLAEPGAKPSAGTTSSSQPSGSTSQKTAPSVGKTTPPGVAGATAQKPTLQKGQGVSAKQSMGKPNPQKKVEQGKKAGKKGDFKQQCQQRLDERKKRDPSTRFSGPYVYDALAGSMENQIESGSLPDGSYERLEFQLARNWNLADDDPLLGQVFYLAGTFSNGTTSTEFEIDSHVEMIIRLVGDKKYKIAKGSNTMTVMFNIDEWFTGIDLSAATVDSDSGKIIIDRSHNTEILSSLIKNIRKSVYFGQDSDGDQQLSTSEIVGQGQEDVEDATNQ